jgi:hypothetical protein
MSLGTAGGVPTSRSKNITEVLVKFFLEIGSPSHAPEN